jgi:hypothetical protein
MSMQQNTSALSSEVLSHWAEHALVQRAAHDIIAAFMD